MRSNYSSSLPPNASNPSNMSFPHCGSYFTFCLDPAASLQDIDDEDVAKAAREIKPGIYVACAYAVRHHTLPMIGSLKDISITATPSISRSSNRASRATIQHSSPNLACALPFDRTPNTRKVADLFTAAIHYLGTDATTSRCIVRTCGLGWRS